MKGVQAMLVLGTPKQVEGQSQRITACTPPAPQVIEPIQKK
jgi:hypothetical protein